MGLAVECGGVRCCEPACVAMWGGRLVAGCGVDNEYGKLKEW